MRHRIGRAGGGGEKEGRHGRIEIADQGVGIASDDLPRIFDRFYQVDGTATRRYGGTGMGLALVQRLVAASAATVHVVSVEGEGTRVILVWPAPPQGATGDAGAVTEGEPDSLPASPVLPVQ